MCRFLLIKDEQEFNPRQMLEEFAEACHISPEYQGHGWGLCWRSNGTLHHHHSLKPIWEDSMPEIGATRAILAHARSAFRDQDIAVENNMPFVAGRWAFAFNGELHGVRLQQEGRTGAAKILNLITGLDRGDTADAFTRAISVIRRRSAHIKALNMVLTDMDTVMLCSEFSERPDYFTVHAHQEPGRLAISSAPLPSLSEWRSIPNGTVEVLH